MKFHAALLALALPFFTLAADGDGFTPLFNGKDLTGWRPINVAKDTFRVQDGMIVTTGVPTGFMATQRM